MIPFLWKLIVHEHLLILLQIIPLGALPYMGFNRLFASDYLKK
jgi:hypothetical protein